MYFSLCSRIALFFARYTLNIGNEHVHCVVQHVGEREGAPVAEGQPAYAHFLPSLRAVADYRSDPLGEAFAGVGAARNMSVAGCANCWRAEVNERETGRLVQNEVAVSW